MYTALQPLAHAGPHDLSTGDGVLHTLTAPDHLLAAAACLAAAYFVFFARRRLARRKPEEVRPWAPSPSGRGRG